MNFIYDPTLGRKWIAPSVTPSREQVDQLREALAHPGVLQAWLVGTAYARSDEIWRVQTDIAVVLDGSITILDLQGALQACDWLPAPSGLLLVGTHAISERQPPGLEEHGLRLIP